MPNTSRPKTIYSISKEKNRSKEFQSPVVRDKKLVI